MKTWGSEIAHWLIGVAIKPTAFPADTLLHAQRGRLLSPLKPPPPSPTHLTLYTLKYGRLLVEHPPYRAQAAYHRLSRARERQNPVPSQLRGICAVCPNSIPGVYPTSASSPRTAH